MLPVSLYLFFASLKNNYIYEKINNFNSFLFLSLLFLSACSLKYRDKENTVDSLNIPKNTDNEKTQQVDLENSTTVTGPTPKTVEELCSLPEGCSKDGIDVSLLPSGQQINIKKCWDLFGRYSTISVSLPIDPPGNAYENSGVFKGVVTSVMPKNRDGYFEVVFYGSSCMKELTNKEMVPACYHSWTCVLPNKEQELLYSLLESKTDINIRNLLLQQDSLVPELGPLAKNYGRITKIDTLKGIIIFETSGQNVGADVLIHTNDPEYFISLGIINGAVKKTIQKAHFDTNTKKWSYVKEIVVVGRAPFDKILTLIKDSKLISLEGVYTEEFLKKREADTLF